MNPAFKGRARGKHKPGVMNSTELAYSVEILDIEQIRQQILWYAFEAITLKLAADTRYTPDFLVLRADGQLECREVKGFWQDDAKVKIKVAAEKFPFRFLAVKRRPKKDGGGWETTEF